MPSEATNLVSRGACACIRGHTRGWGQVGLAECVKQGVEERATCWNTRLRIAAAAPFETSPVLAHPLLSPAQASVGHLESACILGSGVLVSGTSMVAGSSSSAASSTSSAWSLLPQHQQCRHLQLRRLASPQLELERHLNCSPLLGMTSSSWSPPSASIKMTLHLTATLPKSSRMHQPLVPVLPRSRCPDSFQASSGVFTVGLNWLRVLHSIARRSWTFGLPPLNISRGVWTRLTLGEKLWSSTSDANTCPASLVHATFC
jgi:hypothetical protein